MLKKTRPSSTRSHNIKKSSTRRRYISHKSPQKQKISINVTKNIPKKQSINKKHPITTSPHLFHTKLTTYQSHQSIPQHIPTQHTYNSTKKPHFLSSTPNFNHCNFLPPSRHHHNTQRSYVSPIHFSTKNTKKPCLMSYSPRVFRPTQTSRFIGRIAIVAGLVAIGYSATIIARAGAAFIDAYKNTKTILEPQDISTLNHAIEDVANAAQDVLTQQEEEEKRRIIYQLEREENEKKRINEVLENKNIENKNQYHHDDMRLHLTDEQHREELAAIDRGADYFIKYFPTFEEEILHDVMLKWEYLLRGDGSGFNDEMTVLEAEKILGTQTNPCIEEIKHRRGVSMRLNHPDQGGSPFLATKINEAFEILIPHAKSDPEWEINFKIQQDMLKEQRAAALKQFHKEELIKQGILDPETGKPLHPDGKSFIKDDDIDSFNDQYDNNNNNKHTKM